MLDSLALANSSAGEHCLHTAGVTGSIPVAPTIFLSKLAILAEHFADLKKRCAIHYQPTREGVTQVMDVEILDPCPSTGGSEGLSHIIDPVSNLGFGG